MFNPLILTATSIYIAVRFVQELLVTEETFFQMTNLLGAVVAVGMAGPALGSYV